MIEECDDREEENEGNCSCGICRGRARGAGALCSIRSRLSRLIGSDNRACSTSFILSSSLSFSFPFSFIFTIIPSFVFLLSSISLSVNTLPTLPVSEHRSIPSPASMSASSDCLE